MASRPERPGKPRSTTATSIGYSSPANSPSTPSAASSTANPVARNCCARLSRSAGSSSRTRRRMAEASVLAPGRRVDADLEYAAVVREQPDPVFHAVAVPFFLGLRGASLVTPLRPRDRLVERDGGLRLGALAAAVAAVPVGSPRIAGCQYERCEQHARCREEDHPLHRHGDILEEPAARAATRSRAP